MRASRRAGRARGGASPVAGARPWAGIVWGAGLSLLAPAPASAHLGHIILRAERYLKLDASEADTRVVVSLTLGASEGERVLEAADRDSDGVVTAAEADTYMREWGNGLRAELPVELDGRPVELTWTEPFLDPIGPVAQVPVTVEMVAHLPTDGREHLVVIHDRMVRRETFDRTDVAFRAHDGARIIASGPGELPVEHEPTLAYGRAAGGASPDHLSARVLYPERAEATPLAAWVGGAAAVAAALSALALSLRARARRKSR